jgi:hypothetical protein
MLLMAALSTNTTVHPTPPEIVEDEVRRCVVSGGHSGHSMASKQSSEGTGSEDASPSATLADGEAYDTIHSADTALQPRTAESNMTTVSVAMKLRILISHCQRKRASDREGKLRLMQAANSRH